MELDHEFVVPVPPAEAWPVLLDIERIGPCMPGATVTGVEGDSFTGTVKVKVGPITVSYGGEAHFVEKDEASHRVVIEARGKEARGTGTAAATVTARLEPAGDGTRVTVHTDLAITGKPAQFGRGVMADVGGRLIGQFASCLAEQLTIPEAAPAPEAELAPVGAEAPAPAGAPAEGAAPAAAPAAPAAARPAPAPRPTPEAIDLFEAAGASVVKRLAPVVAAVLVVVIAIVVWRRRH